MVVVVLQYLAPLLLQVFLKRLLSNKSILAQITWYSLPFIQYLLLLRLLHWVLQVVMVALELVVLECAMAVVALGLVGGLLVACLVVVFVFFHISLTFNF